MMGRHSIRQGASHRYVQGRQSSAHRGREAPRSSAGAPADPHARSPPRVRRPNRPLTSRRRRGPLALDPAGTGRGGTGRDLDVDASLHLCDRGTRGGAGVRNAGRGRELAGRLTTEQRRPCVSKHGVLNVRSCDGLLAERHAEAPGGGHWAGELPVPPLSTERYTPVSRPQTAGWRA